MSGAAYCLRLVNWKVFRSSWDAAQSIVAAGAILLTLGAALARIPVHDFPVWSPALPFGAFLLFGILRNGYSIYKEEALSGVTLREKLNLATDPTLCEDVVRLCLTQAPVPAIGTRAEGYQLGIEVTNVSPSTVYQFRIRVDRIDAKRDDAWTPSPDGRTVDILPVRDIPPSATERWTIVTSIFGSKDDPRFGIGQVPSFRAGSYRLTLRFDAYAHQSRYVRVHFTLRGAALPDTAEPLLNWDGGIADPNPSDLMPSP